MARDIANSEEGRTSRRLRKKVEMLFADVAIVRPMSDARPQLPEVTRIGSRLGKPTMPSPATRLCKAERVRKTL